MSISGPWAALIRAARSLTWVLLARVAARSAISMACRWWAVICWAKATSASLWVLADALDDEVLLPLAAPDWSLVLSPPPQAVSTSAVARPVRATVVWGVMRWVDTGVSSIWDWMGRSRLSPARKNAR